MILVTGDLMVDVLLLPELRGEEQSGGVLLRGGGSAANTAAWLAYLGTPTAFAGCVGDDPAGIMLGLELKSSGVQSHVLTVAERETGAVVVRITDAGERLMRSARGANETLSPADLLRLPSQPWTAIHLTGYALLGPHGFDLLAAAAEIARRSGALLSFDPSSSGVISRVGADRLLEEMERADVGLLLPNILEARDLTGLPGAVDAAVALSAVVPTVVVKAGAGGAAYGAGTAAGHVPAVASEAVDTTGAGDAFNAGVLAGLNAGDDLRRACIRAHAVARECIARYGGRP